MVLKYSRKRKRSFKNPVSKRKRVRYARRRPFRRSRRFEISRTPGLPAILRMKHTYVLSRIMNVPGTPVGAGKYYMTNGLYNPEFTNSGATHRPLSFGTVSSMYSEYRVVGSSITYTIANGGQSTNDTFTMRAITYIDSNTNTLLDSDDLAQQPGAFSKLIQVSDRPVTITRRWSAARAFGATRYDDDFTGNATKNPDRGNYFFLFLQQPTPIADFSVSVVIRMVFHVVWTNRVEAK